MQAAQTTWASTSSGARADRRGWSANLVIVAVVCVILGLEFVAVVQTAGGVHAYGMIASQSMQTAE